MSDEISLEFLAEQQRRIINDLREFKLELAEMRDDRTVMIAILNRLDAGQDSVSAEMRAMRSQFDRFRSEVRKKLAE